MAAHFAICPPRPVLRLEAESICGPFWIEYGAHAYPQRSWDDLPVSALIRWLRSVPDLFRPRVRQVRFEFCAGPRGFRLVTDDGITWELHAFRHTHLIGHEFQGPIELEEFLRELRRAACAVLIACAESGLQTNDVRALAVVVRATPE